MRLLRALTLVTLSVALAACSSGTEDKTAYHSGLKSVVVAKNLLPKGTAIAADQIGEQAVADNEAPLDAINMAECIGKVPVRDIHNGEMIGLRALDIDQIPEEATLHHWDALPADFKGESVPVVFASQKVVKGDYFGMQNTVTKNVASKAVGAGYVTSPGALMGVAASHDIPEGIPIIASDAAAK